MRPYTLSLTHQHLDLEVRLSLERVRAEGPKSQTIQTPFPNSKNAQISALPTF